MPFDNVIPGGPTQHADLARLSRRLICEVMGPQADTDPPAMIPVLQAVEMMGRAWMMGGEVVLQAVAGVRACRICGCTQNRACDPPCSWAAQDLCSACLMRV